MDTLDTLPTTRKTARMFGIEHYDTGKPCPKGHYSERLTLTSKCVACCNESSRIRKERLIGRLGEDTALELLRQNNTLRCKRYRQQNREKQRDYMKQYMKDYAQTDKGALNIKNAHQRYNDKAND